ncbi:zinc-binding dehydrogenase [Companilactobacillus mishanensis]|uniref:Zinc-binding dehydrogenase n=1 Tax=Companilactobacillus mishanensis TaxID=2486008 RepID=A0A5P0ZG16_9LACO|nr:zinc-binding dehydrogenase [Companilactobacillus mishanensis]MQS51984.1 zinc-binding dehydrogenase [Companilactobacillus mishanensis]MQS88902.1 zinc-binding dehydrogenase [Companilactobacillus mishanensis]
MKSVVIEKAGGPEVLDIKERPIPEATKDETVIQIHAFTVHRYEVLTREGGSPSVKFPRVIGVEAVGEVYQPAENSNLKKGQKVVSFNGGLGRAFDGSYQEYALIPDNFVYPVDFDGSWTELASIPETFYTAFGALKSMHLAKGQSLLVRGGTTGVGMAALVLAKAMGLTVGSTTRQSAREPELTKMGANDVILDKDGKLQTDKKYDNAIDLVGVSASVDTLSHVNQGGFYSLVGMVNGEWIWKEFDPFTNLAGKFATVYDSTNVDQYLVNEMFDLINKNHLQIPIAKVFKLDQIQDAHEYVMEKNRPLGQVVVSND